MQLQALDPVLALDADFCAHLLGKLPLIPMSCLLVNKIQLLTVNSKSQKTSVKFVN